jgi:hypothetical protein
MATLLSTKDAAARLGISERTVRLICAREGLGVLISARSRVLTESDLAAIQAARKSPGNPLFGKKFGNGKAKRGKDLRKRTRAKTKK